jgi:cell division transport system permease protein
MVTSLRPRGADDLGLRRALSDRLLPLLVASMVFLASLALAGAVAASGLAHHWQGGAAALVTVQVPQPDLPATSGQGTTRAAAIEAALKADAGLAAHRLGPDELAVILRPWLGDEVARLSLALPAVFEVKLRSAVSSDLEARLSQVAPGTLVEQNGVWLGRLGVLAASLQASAALALLVVALVATAVVAIATRAGLAARRDAIEIVHGLGATDRMIARQFAGRVTLLVFCGALIGMLFAVPLLLGLASLTAPFQPGLPPGAATTDLLDTLPPALWALLPALPVAAAAIGWLTTQSTVRRWLAVLP